MRLSITAPLLKCGLWTVTSIQRGQHGKWKKEKFYSEETQQTLPQPGGQLWCHANNLYSWYDTMKIDTLSLRSSSPKPNNSCLIMRRTSDNQNWKRFCKISDQYLTKLSRLSKTRSLKNCHSVEEPKVTWQVKLIWYSGWHHGSEKDFT